MPKLKIVALRIQPIARVIAAIYAIFGASFWITYCFSKAPYFTLPVGLVAPMVHFNFNFHFHRTTDVLYNLLLFLASVAGYALTGWLTAMALVICFNVAARSKAASTPTLSLSVETNTPKRFLASRANARW